MRLLYNCYIRFLTIFLLSSKQRKLFRKMFLLKNTKEVIKTKNVVKPINNTEDIANNIDSSNKIYLISDDNTKKEICNYPGLNINFMGENSLVILHESTHFGNCNITLGDNNLVIINKSKYVIYNFNMPWKMSPNNKLIIGKDFSCSGCCCYLHDESNLLLKIGNDCMFSFDITIWPSDGHTILDLKTNQILNSPKKVLKIGNHCWIGKGVDILKNSNLPDGSIVGCKSLVNKFFIEKNTILAGIPANIVKKNIDWKRENTDIVLKSERYNND